MNRSLTTLLYDAQKAKDLFDGVRNELRDYARTEEGGRMLDLVDGSVAYKLDRYTSDITPARLVKVLKALDNYDPTP